MVSYYGYEMWRHKLQAVKPCLSENACSFKFFKIKRLVDELVQSNPLCVILHVKRKKVLILPVFTWFLIIDKIQDGHQDGDHVWWRHRPPAAPPPMNIAHLVEKVKGFPLKAKSFRNIATYQKPKGGGIHRPPTTLYHGGGMTLRVRPRVKTIKMTGEDTSCPSNCA